MPDLQTQLAALRAEADQELRADGDWADITIPARLFLQLLDALEPKYNRGNVRPAEPDPRPIDAPLANQTHIRRA